MKKNQMKFTYFLALVMLLSISCVGLRGAESNFLIEDLQIISSLIKMEK